MRSLFLKIFLWFWGAMALTVIAFATVVANTQSQPTRSTTFLNVRSPLWGEGKGRSDTPRGPQGGPRDNDGPPDDGDGPPEGARPDKNRSGPFDDGPRHGFARDDASPFVALQVATELMKEEGLPAATRYLTRVEQVGNASVQFFDSQGKATRSSPTNDGIQQQLSALAAQARQSGRPEIASFDNSETSPLLAAQQGHTPDGKLYVVALAWSDTANIRRSGPPRRGGPRGILPGFLLFADTKTQLLRLLAVLATTGLVCYLLARHLTAPLLQLRDATRRLATGKFSARVDSRLRSRRDEMGVLGRDFDLMAERIETLVKAQNRLLADVSHELRSPLARLSMALELVRQTATPESKPDLDRIEREAERLNSMIGQLLTISRLESGQQQPDDTLINVTQLVSEVCEDANFEAQKQGSQVRFVNQAPFAMTGTASLLRSAIENVVRNAVRYTDTGTAVEVSLTHEPSADTKESEYAIIRVRDHGSGVPDVALPNLFRPFYRVEGARDRQSGGEGLGLAITEAATKLHGGRTRALNAPDGGLIVEVLLPLNKTSA